MSHILVIDDEEVIRSLIVEILETAGHDATGAESAERALELLDAGEFDLVVSDVIMPGLSGLELLELVESRSASLPVVLVTGAGTYETLSQALTRGAAGLVTKPFAHADLQSAVADALERANRRRDEIRERLLTPTLASALANAIEARDSSSARPLREARHTRGAHRRTPGADGPTRSRPSASARSSTTSARSGSRTASCSSRDRSTQEERAIVETHPEIGDTLLEPLDLLAPARPIVRHHHERWDGAGYPDGLAAAEIPLGARIVAVADSVEVMSSRQLYQSPRDAEQVKDELRAHRGAQWDPEIVDLASG